MRVISKWQFWLLTTLGFVSLLLVIANIVLANGNLLRQSEINQRQQFVQQSLQLETLYKEIVRALGELATKNNDEQVKALLSSQGLTIAPASTPTASVGGSPTPTSDGKKK